MVIDQVDAAESLGSVVDGLLSVDLDQLDHRQLLELTERVEVLKRRLAAVDHRLVAALDDRRVAHKFCQPSTAALLRSRLRITPAEAKRRVRAATDLGPRRTLLGEPLPPLFENVAAAQVAGMISESHARVIVLAVDALPAAVAAEHDLQVEATLLEHALVFDPLTLRKVAVKLADVLDPDGSLPTDTDHQRRREFFLAKYRDGSAKPRGRLSPALTARIEALLDATAEPRPAVDGMRDQRTPGQRNHDALDDAMVHLLGCSKAPRGNRATLMITMTATQYETRRRGHVQTPHGSPITVDTALELVSDGRIRSLVFDAHGGVLDYGRAQRFVPPGLREALIARDKGCTFPGCDRPPAWTQAHHVTEWIDFGPTALDNCLLVCGYHHREFERQGWQCQIIDHLPYWIAPAWLDPDQIPRRNRMHDPPLRT